VTDPIPGVVYGFDAVAKAWTALGRLSIPITVATNGTYLTDTFYLNDTTYLQGD